ncbi:hypothetical protein ACSCB1_42905 [Streptomyces europaeiscabiei]|uniref:hypothetical protein n=1 Tax=Streptomyces europaeiscabiei TaxID=146819 RepID=UPI000628494D|nr:hypothetical protein [Streptomyces europaeiscabiei]MDX2527909.1 hypothetical protein [Streptomyces europaeiscabiei]MDX2762772.1 hypothetical protein [Streptomyces europaeiscabiei]MDX2769782.1 hypothetical protein [Streptomyces europaeiscabiei]MDX3670582.1 hypothetical protein [Streptomyces europaeiscabiei]MDX3716241.1 hypothetical protein [Streptomyces europaeiscabiei]
MGFKGFTAFTGFKKAAVVAGAALAFAVVGGQGPAQAQAHIQAQAHVQAAQSGVTALGVVDSIAERVCATPLPVRLPLCGEQGGDTSKPVNGWQIEKPKA